MAIAHKLAADCPIVAVVLLDEDLRGTAFEFKNVGHSVGDGGDEASALFQGTAPGDVHGDKRHEFLPSRLPL